LPERIVVGESGYEDLERHVALESLVPSAVDLPHPTAPDQFVHAVAGDLGADPDSCGRGHRTIILLLVSNCTSSPTARGVRRPYSSPLWCAVGSAGLVPPTAEGGACPGSRPSQRRCPALGSGRCRVACTPRSHGRPSSIP